MAYKGHLYMRDVFWQNCRKYAIAKLDNPTELTAYDVVLNIIGRRCGEDDTKNDGTMNCRQIADAGASCSVSSTFTSNPHHLQGRKRVLNQQHSFAMKKRKLLLEHLELNNYKAKLEIALMEKQMGCPSSVFTKDLVKMTASATNVTPKNEVAESCQYEKEFYANNDESEDDNSDKTRMQFVTDNKLPFDLLSK